METPLALTHEFLVNKTRWKKIALAGAGFGLLLGVYFLAGRFFGRNGVPDGNLGILLGILTAVLLGGGLTGTYFARKVPAWGIRMDSEGVELGFGESSHRKIPWKRIKAFRLTREFLFTHLTIEIEDPAGWIRESLGYKAVLQETHFRQWGTPILINLQHFWDKPQTILATLETWRAAMNGKST